MHFVNYNRTEPAQKRSPGSGIKDEKPIAAPGFRVEFLLPPTILPLRLEFISPESPEPATLRFQREGAAIHFDTPGFLVYGLVRVLIAD